MIQEAKCPECDQWSDVICENYISPFVYIEKGKEVIKPVHVWGWWWKNSGGCPKCDALICVETECDFREAK